MKLHEKAYKLAAAGRSNAEIFGELEVTTTALSAMLSVEPRIIFSILSGRAEFSKILVETIRQLGLGWDEQMGAKPNLAALQLLLDRMDRNNSALTAAYDLTMLAGTSMSEGKEARDPASVTSLLRAVK